ncbi:MAG: cupin domain-containing protein [Acutalibacteraceae bacterium]|nr:cupin domain-containing protein [Clostridia bacterium]MEE1283617.1 cupin domain-containing protein [Acutalibacteraceae bacterium]
MIKRAEEMNSSVKVNMRDGDGQVVVTNLLDAGEYKGKSRLVATLTLEPGCSIGEHVHENEEEIFYIVEGEAQYYDDGEWVTLYKGDSCLCLGGQKHSIANRSDKTLVVAAVILTY